MEVLFPNAAVVCDFLTRLSDIPERREPGSIN